jgi:hypothetical protein
MGAFRIIVLIVDDPTTMCRASGHVEVKSHGLQDGDRGFRQMGGSQHIAVEVEQQVLSFGRRRRPVEVRLVAWHELKVRPLTRDDPNGRGSLQGEFADLGALHLHFPASLQQDELDHEFSLQIGIDGRELAPKMRQSAQRIGGESQGTDQVKEAAQAESVSADKEVPQQPPIGL